MRVLIINSVCGKGSTGRICTGIADMLKAHGHEAYIAYGLGHSSYKGSFCISEGKIDYYIHNILSRLTDSEGLHSTKSTKRLLQKIETLKPDIVHLHTLHGHYLNYKLLLKYLRSKDIPVVMTLHDCWAFTGHCAHFMMSGCDKWKYGCQKCSFLNEYPQSWLIDNTRNNYYLKKKLLIDFGEKLYIVPVSYWLEGLVKQSFLKDIKIETIHNGIDLNVFKPTYNNQLFSEYTISGKKIVLGVASPWSAYKGFKDFVKMRSLLPEKYVIIMVGVSSEQMKEIPNGIIGIERTDSPQKLAELYTLANVFVNTTYCDNYPTVNLEAIACGTPVITYRTGGSPESIDIHTGDVIEQGDMNGLVESVIRISNNSQTYKAACTDKAMKLFDNKKCFEKYLTIYKKILHKDDHIF